MTTEPIECPRCRMTFHVGIPRQGERTRCTEKNCQRVFWHNIPGTDYCVRCYVEPEAA